MHLPKGLPTEAVLAMLYQYIPNKGAAATAVALYALLSIAVAAVSIRTRLYYMLLVALTALLELAGWGTRLTTLTAPEATAYSVHQALLIISPALLVIVQYITLSKLLLLMPACRESNRAGSSTTNSHSNQQEASSSGTSTSTSSSSSSSSSVISTDSSSASEGHDTLAKVVLAFFTAGQVLCVVLETSGGALYSDLDANELYGRLLLMAGLGLQLSFDSGFIALTAIVQRSKSFGFRGDKAFRPIFSCLYATTFLMHWRNVFRVAEFSQGRDGDVAKHEAYLYVFDFMPMYACFLLFTFMHYGFWLGPQAPALLARQAVLAPRSLELDDKQQQQQPDGDILHVHCS